MIISLRIVSVARFLCAAVCDNNNLAVVAVSYPACSGRVKKIKINSPGIRNITLFSMLHLLLLACGSGLHH